MAHPAKDKFECMEKCAADEKCKSATFNGPTSVNSNICVLAYGDPAEKNGSFTLRNDSDLTTAPRCCHCPCDDTVNTRTVQTRSSWDDFIHGLFVLP